MHPDDLDKDDGIDRAYPEVDDSIEETLDGYDALVDSEQVIARAAAKYQASAMPTPTPTQPKPVHATTKEEAR